MTGFSAFQANKIPDISLMNFQNSRIIIRLISILQQSVMLLQRTVVAVNMVKLKTLVSIVCTLVRTITVTQVHPFPTICMYEHDTLLRQSNFVIFFLSQIPWLLTGKK